MSTLEIVLAIALALGLAIYIAVMTVKIVRKKKSQKLLDQIEDVNEEEEK